MNKKLIRMIFRYITITLVSILYGAGTSLFLSPNDLVPGGLTGIAMILNRFLPLSVGSLFMIMNIPIIAIALYKFGFKFIISTFYAISCVSFFTDIFAKMSAVTKEPLLAVFVGDILIAIAIAVVFKCGATTGGADIIVKLLRLRYPHIKTGRLFMMFDISVIALSGILFHNIDAALYAFIGIFVMSAVMDMVLYGQDEAKALTEGTSAAIDNVFPVWGIKKNTNSVFAIVENGAAIGGVKAQAHSSYLPYNIVYPYFDYQVGFIWYRGCIICIL